MKIEIVKILSLHNMIKELLPVLKILGRFLAIYLVFLLLYQLYLNPYEGKDIDGFSAMVAKQVKYTQNALGYKTLLYNEPERETIHFYTVNQYTTRMVEGCNALSIIILFMAFVFAFYKGAKTFVFVILSVIFLHIINVLRIAGLNMVYYENPDYGKMAHDYLFPAIIYGSVVLLWLIWIKRFVLKPDHEEA